MQNCIIITKKQSEVEETLNRIKTHKGVSGIVIVNSEGVPIRSTLDLKYTLQYSALISQLTAKARSVVRDLDPQVFGFGLVCLLF